MRYRIFILVALTLILGATAIGTGSSGTQEGQDARRPEGARIPISVTQLPAEKGIIPVELRCGPARLPAPNNLEDIPCVLKNNTAKDISAAAVSFSVVVEKDGAVITDTNVLTIETYIHADLYTEQRHNTIPPGGESPVQPLPVSYDDAVVIKGVTMQVDYVEFTDKTTSGPNYSGSRIIAEVREGAAKYRDWLFRKYEQSGGSADAVLPLLDKGRPLPAELELKTGNLDRGAVIYRNYVRKTYESKGVEGLIKYLHRKTAAATGRR